MAKRKVRFEFFLVRWTDGRPGPGWYDGNSGVTVAAENAKQWKTRRGADNFVARGFPAEVVLFVATRA